MNKKEFIDRFVKISLTPEKELTEEDIKYFSTIKEIRFRFYNIKASPEYEVLDFDGHQIYVDMHSNFCVEWNRESEKSLLPLCRLIALCANNPKNKTYINAFNENADDFTYTKIVTISASSATRLV